MWKLETLSFAACANFCRHGRDDSLSTLKLCTDSILGLWALKTNRSLHHNTYKSTLLQDAGGAPFNISELAKINGTIYSPYDLTNQTIWFAWNRTGSGFPSQAAANAAWKNVISNVSNLFALLFFFIKFFPYFRLCLLLFPWVSCLSMMCNIKGPSSLSATLYSANALEGHFESSDLYLRMINLPSLCISM